jgi:hypothetical protein
MHTFKHAHYNEPISHDSLKEAAGVPEYIPQFLSISGEWLFQTDNPALAAAFDELLATGHLPHITNITPPGEPNPLPAKKGKVVTDAPNS